MSMEVLMGRLKALQELFFERLRCMHAFTELRAFRGHLSVLDS